MKRILHILATLALLAAAALGAGCAGGAKRVSPPAAMVQQLQVQADGSWTVDVRLHNYSSVSMRFDHVRLELSVDEHPAGTLEASPALSIGPTAADVVQVTLRPQPMARLAVADALASRRALSYRLEGTVRATPDEAGKAREFKGDGQSALNPAPGLEGVLR
ncbi:LEA type 2 family protein [Pseudoxanthomonas taiwanensis]|uniref:Late embryogenesis abundant protein LEA-2 subgroup domain-containing protein n=1 Tax=Pseudoxanthomonas taiwanensis TaxID=176598 RepID=A0A921P6H9_9GAMM|nr:LEA type 2 family protein [Pseudoxanthomonas taiwanensis]KAF1690997.1 hypothetical protein CR938_00560 [Pseudoxanthomonas taiwanensis]